MEAYLPSFLQSIALTITFMDSALECIAHRTEMFSSDTCFPHQIVNSLNTDTSSYSSFVLWLVAESVKEEYDSSVANLCRQNSTFTSSLWIYLELVSTMVLSNSPHIKTNVV